MKISTIQQYKDQLLSLREQVRNEIRDSLEALPEEVVPIGEHDRQPSEGLDKELALEHTEQAIYREINAALERMDAGTFGRCLGCGATISKARLNAIPYAAYCLKCERNVEAEL